MKLTLYDHYVIVSRGDHQGKDHMLSSMATEHYKMSDTTTGAVLVSESIVAILPGADLVPEIQIDRAMQYEAVRRALEEFRAFGGSAIVDLGGLSTGRDAEQLELFERTTGVRIIASTGLGPLWTVGSHFTNNVSTLGMTVERMADIFIGELTEGLLVPPRTRAAARAGVVSATAAGGGEFESRILRASAQAAMACGAPLFLRVGDDPLGSLATVESEGLPPDRVLVGTLDRVDHVLAGLPAKLAARGYSVALDHVGWPEGTGYVSSDERIRAVLDLFESGHGDRVAVSSSAIGAAVELPSPVHGDFSGVLREFVPEFRKAGGTDEQVTILLNTTPRRLLGDAFDTKAG
jgi:phosphotriesterase-related protein